MDYNKDGTTRRENAQLQGERIQIPMKKGLRIIEKNPYSLLSDKVRECKEIGEMLPPAMKRGKGPYVYDYDGNRFVDFFLAHGSLTLGHTPPGITKVMKGWVGRGYGSGYLTASHALLAKKLDSLLLKGWNLGRTKHRWFFYDSACGAVAALMGLLRRAGYSGVLAYLSKNDSDRLVLGSPFDWMKKLSPSCMEGADFTSLGCVFVRVGKEKETMNAVRRLGERGVLVVSDETRVESFLHMRNRTALSDAVQVRIFGNWVASGVSFGCLWTSENFNCRISLENSSRSIHTFLSLIGTPPLYTIKTAATAAALLEKGGGIEQITSRNNDLFSYLGENHFSFCDGLVYMKKSEPILSEYRKLHSRLLQEGIYFPYCPEEPIHTSGSHTDELLKKSAEKIRSLFKTFYR